VTQKDLRDRLQREADRYADEVRARQAFRPDRFHFTRWEKAALTVCLLLGIAATLVIIWAAR
jgi:hypothetical protein